MGKCQDAAICPLMVASHDARYAGIGCIDHGEMRCRAERGHNRRKMLRDALAHAIELKDTPMAGACFVALARTAGEPS